MFLQGLLSLISKQSTSKSQPPSPHSQPQPGSSLVQLQAASPQPPQPSPNVLQGEVSQLPTVTEHQHGPSQQDLQGGTGPGARGGAQQSSDPGSFHGTLTPPAAGQGGPVCGDHGQSAAAGPDVHPESLPLRPDAPVAESAGAAAGGQPAEDLAPSQGVSAGSHAPDATPVPGMVVTSLHTAWRAAAAHGHSQGADASEPSLASMQSIPLLDGWQSRLHTRLHGRLGHCWLELLGGDGSPGHHGARDHLGWEQSTAACPRPPPDRPSSADDCPAAAHEPRLKVTPTFFCFPLSRTDVLPRDLRSQA